MMAMRLAHGYLRWVSRASVKLIEFPKACMVDS